MTRIDAIRTVTAVSALLLGTAASPPSAAFLISAQSNYDAPSSTTTSRRPVGTTDITEAPMPNSDLSAPAPFRAIGNQASVSPSLFSPRNAYHGEGYVPGSTVQTEQEKHLRPAPGINLSVPLQ